jgi:putative nucleotidyltransferase with HDIG domain
MTHEKLGRLSEWYDSYTRSFLNGDTRLEDAVRLKYDHTRRVCTEMEALCKSIALDEHSGTLALTAALLHDIWRFEQFRQYRTFSDKQSKDHAGMGVKLIEEFNLLDRYDPVDADDVKKAIRHHNAVAVPPELNDAQSLLCRLLRDADKLDIYNIVLDYYIKPDPDRKETVQVGFADGDGVTPEVCDSIRTGKPVLYEQVRTLADFKMIQAGWIYDLNFPHSFRCVYQRGYLNRLRKELPGTPEVSRALDTVERYLSARI